VLKKCHGMRIALLDKKQQLFVRESRSGEKWQINLDRYSMFMRQISGRSVDLERQTISQLKRHHSGIGHATPMRIFTRRMDAYVLGGLDQILGAGYRSRKTTQARCRLNGDKISITDIVVDGISHKGQIEVPCPPGRRLKT
jgi:hypothetical protein